MFEHKAVGLNFFIIDKYFKAYLKKSLKKYNLNAAEGLVLLVFFKYHNKISKDDLDIIHTNKIGKTQDEIISELHYDKGVIARTMQSLEDKNYVIRNDNPKDNRSYIFQLTEEAIEIKPHLLEILNEWNKILLQGIDDELVYLVKSQLDKMADNIINSNKI
ncbi:transcriptional regulator, SarA/Rot family [Terrisporobacter sp.]